MRQLLRRVFRGLLLVLGIFSAGLGIQGFLLANNFIDGGVTGVSMLLAKLTPLPLWFWLPAVNLPFIALGLGSLGRAFALRSVAAIAGLALVVAVVPFPQATPDRVLSAVFGGFFLGAGIGLAIQAGTVLDGTEIAALLISRRTRIVRVGEVILAFNVVLFLGAISVLGIEAALYSILTYLAAARTLNFVVYGLEEYTAMTIVSSHNALIRDRITRELRRGVTVYRGYGGLTGQEQEILYCVVTRLEVGRVREIVRSIDEAAFLTSHPLADVEGGVVKRTGLH